MAAVRCGGITVGQRGLPVVGRRRSAVLGLIVAGLAIGAAAPAGAGATTITTCDQPTLRTAVRNGGSYDFGIDCSLTLTSTLVVPADKSVVLNANGHSVSLDGGNAVRHFTVRGTLELDGMTLQDGLASGAAAPNASPGDNGTDGAGGSGGSDGTVGGCIAGDDVGGNGTRGQPGTLGGPGPAGAPGGDAQGGSIYIYTSGAVTVVNDTLTQNVAFGGRGGTGGAGGTGGDGGHGGGGGRGADGVHPPVGLSCPGAKGGNGNIGGVGGAGGAGGLGGAGGVGQGGAVYNKGTLTVTGGTISSNQAVGGDGGTGGAGGAGGLGGNGGDGGPGGGDGLSPADGGKGGRGGATGGSGPSGNGGQAGEAEGGAIFSSGSETLSITGTTLSSNVAQAGSGGRGGTSALQTTG